MLVTAALALQFGKKEQDLGMLLRTAACTMAAITALHYLNPVIDFIHTLEEIGGLRNDMLMILLKTVGIGISTEIASATCSDAGSPSLSKTLNLLGTSTILYLSLPVFSSLIELIQQIVRET